MRMLGNGAYAISDRLKIDGEGDRIFVFGRGWLLEVVEVERGEYLFFSDGRRVRSTHRRFGVYYPAFSIVRPYVRDVVGRVTGVGAVKPFAGLPDAPVMFETGHEGEFTDVSQALQVLSTAPNVQSIEINTHPSPLSRKCKKLIDENYLAEPGIGRIAERIKVSHEHMSRQFKADYGMSPSSYLHYLRVAEATFRLSLGQEIIDISGEVGYNDLSRFYKQFRKKTQTSPGECRTLFDR